MVEVGDTWLVLGVAPGTGRARCTACRSRQDVAACAQAPAQRRAGFASLAEADACERRNAMADASALRWSPLPLLRCSRCRRSRRQAGLPAFTSTPAAGGGQTYYACSLQTLLLLTALTFLPAVLLMMTGFTRIIIVLSLLRQALGTPTAPPNQVLIGLALFLTLFVMAPVLDTIYAEAYQPFSREQDQHATQALERGGVPLQAVHAEADARDRPRAVRQARRQRSLRRPDAGADERR